MPPRVLTVPGVEPSVAVVAAQDLSSAASAAVLGGFALIFGLLVWLMLRSNRDLPPGYGTAEAGRRDRRAWAGSEFVEKRHFDEVRRDPIQSQEYGRDASCARALRWRSQRACSHRAP